MLRLLRHYAFLLVILVLLHAATYNLMVVDREQSSPVLVSARPSPPMYAPPPIDPMDVNHPFEAENDPTASLPSFPNPLRSHPPPPPPIPPLMSSRRHRRDASTALSSITTPGIIQGHQHPERFPGQFIQPRFSNGLLRDLSIAAVEFQAMLTFLLPALLGSVGSVDMVAWAFATSLLAAIFIHGGSQCNPSITLQATILGKLSPRQAIFNIMSQLSAALTASGIQKLMTGEVRSVVGLGAGVSVAQGLLIETVLSTILFTAVLYSSAPEHSKQQLTPFLIAFIFLGLELVGISSTGASLNFARQFGPMIVSGTYHSYDWIYTLGPMIAVPLSLLIFKSNQLIQASDAVKTDIGPGRIVEMPHDHHEEVNDADADNVTRQGPWRRFLRNGRRSHHPDVE